MVQNSERIQNIQVNDSQTLWQLANIIVDTCGELQNNLIHCGNARKL